MRSPNAAAWLWLLRKEWRELLVSRSGWMLLVLMGPLTGASFIAAMRSYAEISGVNGGLAGVGEAMAPLIGVWAPTFSACELAAVFLLPFVAIRMVGADRQSGALKLELQRNISPFARMGAKVAVALAGWLIAMLPPASALLLWKSYGGTLYAPELLTLAGGHVLNAALTIALGAAAAAVTEHPSTAAIATLGVTVGTWMIHYFAALQGGLWERAAAFTPAAIIGDFQHGLLRLNAVLVAVLLTLAGLAIAAIWQRLGVRTWRRGAASLLVTFGAAVAIFGAAQVRPSWDLSESRGNSFPAADEQALRGLREPLKIVAHLAPEDPRRTDLERSAFGKLRRLMPNLEIEYQSATSTGLFEQSNAGYGEIWYLYQGRQQMSRVTTADGVLESIYEIAQVQLPGDVPETVFRGHPLAVLPAGASTVFYGLWPGLTLLSGILIRRQLQQSPR
ncbi:MAG: ABC transporter permease [Acidobacteria bacterium]|nr:ABC transporter permease [Acidobacteriota bacterium]